MCIAYGYNVSMGIIEYMILAQEIDFELFTFGLNF